MTGVTSQPTTAERQSMHDLYRKGGQEHQKAPHVVYADAACPHANCGERMQAIDFRLEAYDRAIHDPLVRSWWNDVGFAGQCPRCGGWIHFTIRGKQVISAEQAAQLPHLPADWYCLATIL